MPNDCPPQTTGAKPPAIPHPTAKPPIIRRFRRRPQNAVATLRKPRRP